MATFAERLIAGLKAMGYHEDPRPGTSKYIVLHRNGADRKGRVFVGPNGALRKGSAVSGSLSVGDPSHQTSIYQRILAEGDKALSLTAEGKVDSKALLGQLGGDKP